MQRKGRLVEEDQEQEQQWEEKEKRSQRDKRIRDTKGEAAQEEKHSGKRSCVGTVFVYDKRGRLGEAVAVGREGKEELEGQENSRH